MTYRGIFSSLLSHKLYSSDEKKWVVELEKHHCYWYDLVVNPKEVADYFDTRKLIVDKLMKIKEEVDSHLEKRFIYFICSREKVRFNVKRKPSYNFFTGQVKIHILIGAAKKRKKIKCTFVDINTGKVFRPGISLTEKFITLKDANGYLTTYPIHDFLDNTDINLGIDSRVEYVGYTKNPHTRPTNGAHTGLSDVLHEVAEENRDCLIYFNVFKVTTHSKNAAHGINFYFANAMSNEVDVDLEGKILEKCFIFYFDSVNQSRNKEIEWQELEKNLLKLAQKNKIKAIHIHYEFKEVNDYGIFSSSRVPASERHFFTVRRGAAGVEILNGQ
ncbi:hypothetical protein EHW66_04990 [Erwinia psidii]|uniref:hypothetical protein n=1 Tax=Erwinia psidii TaxID=69224 RepID=UPI00226BBAF7|nr:hypothetical protein [Erwinia psidii]MCX8964389.1 hypothetical protein [Erwinia psidii]